MNNNLKTMIEQLSPNEQEALVQHIRKYYVIEIPIDYKKESLKHNIAKTRMSIKDCDDVIIDGAEINYQYDIFHHKRYQLTLRPNIIAYVTEESYDNLCAKGL